MTAVMVDETARLLKPLLAILRSGRHLRLVARPGAVMIDRPEGSDLELRIRRADGEL